MTRIKKTKPLLSGLDAGVQSMAGRTKNSKFALIELLEDAKRIDSRSHYWRNLSDENLSRRLLEFKDIFRRCRTGYEGQVFSALAAIREAALRRLGLNPYQVQLAGALALYRGYVAEMATGEGKTLTAAIAAVLHGWSGLPCHIITVNDYLADRDANWLRPLYQFCGVSVGCVTSIMESQERRTGYHNDVTYTTSKEIVADFLRDRLLLGNFQHSLRRQINALLGGNAHIKNRLVMRGIHSAIVDEADSILIDEAVTPLIISRSKPNDIFVEACIAASTIAADLDADRDYEIDHKYKEVNLKPGIEDRLDITSEGMSDISRSLVKRGELVRQALTAKEFFHCDSQYVIQDGKVVIVDEFTGRMMPQRTWQAGLHQCIEAKEGLQITPPSETMARLSFQRFYRFFHNLSGMTGTAREAANELWYIYQLPVISIPENKPCRREVHPRRVFLNRETKWQAVLDEIIHMHDKGRPVLIGTRSVRDSEDLAKKLSDKKIACRVLNAVRHKEEARIIERAGDRSAITIATNMAGRGTDIKLELNVANLGGLHVIATECHESKRIDRQLFGRCARQGDPGSAVSFVSLEDELIRRYIPAPVRRVMQETMKQNKSRLQWIPGKSVDLAQTIAQNIAFKRRRSVLKTDTWLEDSLSFAQGDIV